MRKLLFILFFILTPCFAAQDYYQFDSQEKEQNFNKLTSELRCLVCQNQNLAESNAALATDLRNQIYQKVQQGESNQQIVDYLVQRYSHFILYQPPLNSSTLALWFGPFLFLISGIGYLIFYVRRKS